MTGCTEGVAGVEVGIDMVMGDDAKGFELMEKMGPVAAAASGAWLNGFVAPRWSAGLGGWAEGAKGNCGPGVDTDNGLATSGVVGWICPRDKFMNGFGALPSLVGCTGT